MAKRGNILLWGAMAAGAILLFAGFKRKGETETAHKGRMSQDEADNTASRMLFLQRKFTTSQGGFGFGAGLKKWTDNNAKSEWQDRARSLLDNEYLYKNGKAICYHKYADDAIAYITKTCEKGEAVASGSLDKVNRDLEKVDYEAVLTGECTYKKLPKREFKYA